MVYYTRGLELISRHEGSASSYYLYDGGLSVRALTNEAGTVTDTLVFDAFGNETAKTGSTDNSYGFQGEEKDETGLYYLRARYMDPTTGTFTSMDTYGGSFSDPMSLHKYMFANSNPVAYCDPGGHEASLQGMVAAMAISGILSAVDSGILYSLQNKDSDIEKYGKSVYGWNVVTAAMNGFLNGFIMGFIGYALCLVLVFRIILSAVGLCIGIPLIASGIDEINSTNGNKALGAYTIAKGVIITIVSTVGLAKSGAEFFNKYGDGFDSFTETDEYPYTPEAQIRANARQGKICADAQYKELCDNLPKGSSIAREVTIYGSDGTRMRADAVVRSAEGKYTIYEFKSSENAPLTKPQAKTFFDIYNGGDARIAGKNGISAFGKDAVIPGGSRVNIVRPSGTTVYNGG